MPFRPAKHVSDILAFNITQLVETLLESIDLHMFQGQ
jgi:hypothetical protein